MKYMNVAPGMDFSRIIQGFWRLPSWGMSTEELKSFLDACMEMGVNTFDTAEIYGPEISEAELGKALPAFQRDTYKIVTKTGISLTDTADGGKMGYYDTRYNHVVEACKKSLQRLNCEYIDLFLIHREDPCIDLHATAAALKEIKKQGLVKEVGVSNFDPMKFQALNDLMDGELRTNQIEWNPCCFEHFESGMMDLLTWKQIKPMIWSPLCGGKIFSSEEEIYAKARKVFTEMAEKYGVSLQTMIFAWIMYHPVGAMPISGSKNIARLNEAIAALDVELEHADWYKMYIASGQKILR